MHEQVAAGLDADVGDAPLPRGSGLRRGRGDLGRDDSPGTLEFVGRDELLTHVGALLTCRAGVADFCSDVAGRGVGRKSYLQALAPKRADSGFGLEDGRILGDCHAGQGSERQRRGVIR